MGGSWANRKPEPKRKAEKEIGSKHPASLPTSMPTSMPVSCSSKQSSKHSAGTEQRGGVAKLRTSSPLPPGALGMG